MLRLEVCALHNIHQTNITLTNICYCVVKTFIVKKWRKVKMSPVCNVQKPDIWSQKNLPKWNYCHFQKFVTRRRIRRDIDLELNQKRTYSIKSQKTTWDETHGIYLVCWPSLRTSWSPTWTGRARRILAHTPIGHETEALRRRCAARCYSPPSMRNGIKKMRVSGLAHWNSTDTTNRRAVPTQSETRRTSNWT